MKGFIAAFSFLTVFRLPGREPVKEDLVESPAWFPAVGLAIGLGLLLIGWLDRVFDVPRVSAFLAVVFLAGITRGLHLDGLADWADGLGGKDRDDTLRIMSDPSVGSFGIIALIVVLFGKYLCLSELFSRDASFSALVLAPVISRWMLSFFLIRMPYARAEGIAGIFKENPPPYLIQKAGAFVLVCILLLSPLRGLAYWGWGFGVSWLVYRQARGRIGGITGDVLGAMAEASELAVLVLAVFIQA